MKFFTKYRDFSEFVKILLWNPAFGSVSGPRRLLLRVLNRLLNGKEAKNVQRSLRRKTRASSAGFITLKFKWRHSYSHNFSESDFLISHWEISICTLLRKPINEKWKWENRFVTENIRWQMFVYNPSQAHWTTQNQMKYSNHATTTNILNAAKLALLSALFFNWSLSFHLWHSEGAIATIIINQNWRN